MSVLFPNDETIVAIATPPGQGGIGIIRLSGPASISIADQLFRPAHGRQVSSLESHTLTYGQIIDPENYQLIDQSLMGLMRAPRSYTMEDTIEFNCHGGQSVLKQVVELTIRYGAKVAEPGEFTKRAFLNGRLDLAQAEAVADLINAKTELSRQAAANQLVGRLSEEIYELNDQIADLLAEVEATVDFPDEELDLLDRSAINYKALLISDAIKQILQTSNNGRLLREGLKIAILGKPNVGKSSLLNELLAIDRAIVTEIPGTTRDTIEETWQLQGLPIQLVDTAGIRQTNDLVEKMGIEKSKAILQTANLILLVVDASRPLDENDQYLLKIVEPKQTLFVLNKIDLPIETSADELSSRFSDGKTETSPIIIQTSILDSIGIKELEEQILAVVLETDLSQSVLVTNVRHQEALQIAQTSVSQAIDSIQADMAAEFIALDLRGALDSLGDIVGHTTSDDILGRIFSQFCIGK